MNKLTIKDIDDSTYELTLVSGQYSLNWIDPQDKVVTLSLTNTSKHSVLLTISPNDTNASKFIHPLKTEVFKVTNAKIIYLVVSNTLPEPTSLKVKVSSVEIPKKLSILNKLTNKFRSIFKFKKG